MPVGELSLGLGAVGLGGGVSVPGLVSPASRTSEMEGPSSGMMYGSSAPGTSGTSVTTVPKSSEGPLGRQAMVVESIKRAIAKRLERLSIFTMLFPFSVFSRLVFAVKLTAFNFNA